MSRPWTALVLAAGRGPGDPMAKAYGVTHKCALPVAGVPMLARVVGALQESGIIESIAVSVETEDVLSAALGNAAMEVRFTQSTHSAPASVLAAATEIARFPLLITTG